MFSGQELKHVDFTIRNNGFWPDLNLADFQQDRSMSPNIAPKLLSEALISAIVEINISLADYETKQKSKGITTANEIGVMSVDGRSSTVIIYQKAVFARAKADLVGEFVSISNKSTKIDENQEQTTRALLAESSREIRKILGLKRVLVGLI